MTTYEAVIGLEVHAQLLSRTKMFCGCATTFGAAPNTQVCEVCLGLPGALPVPNAKAIELAVRTGLALGCEVRGKSVFARKNYFYPDLSKGYQISQFDQPLNEHGKLVIETAAGKKTCSIVRAHVEEDAAKNLHGIGAGTGTLVDFNRAGTPLIEIVGGPDLRSADEAEAYLKALREILIFAGVNDGNLEEGSFRCDANVSVRPVGQEKFGTRTELKNINSFRFVKKAIDYEIARQEALIEGGGTVKQETRTWSDGQGKTLAMRTKEEAHDYRYFADPDLPPLTIDDAYIAAVKAAMPESAEAKRFRWQAELGLTPYDAQVLTGHPELARYFEETVAALLALTKLERKSAGKKVANFLSSEVLRFTETDGLSARFPLSAERLAELLGLVEDGTINGKIAKDVLSEVASSGKSPKKVIEQKGLAQVTDTGAIDAAIAEIISANPKELEKYKEGKLSVVGFFVGQVMRKMGGKANPATLNELLKKALDA
jgi:aspartyl-tRNA(Asn)/glutamyl-tRNA(Gln) amidotransferase subunit B